MSHNPTHHPGTTFAEVVGWVVIAIGATALGLFIMFLALAMGLSLLGMLVGA